MATSVASKAGSAKYSESVFEICLKTFCRESVEYRGGGNGRPGLQDAAIIPLTSDSKMVTLSTVEAMSCILVSNKVENVSRLLLLSISNDMVVLCSALFHAQDYRI